MRQTRVLIPELDSISLGIHGYRYLAYQRCFRSLASSSRLGLYPIHRYAGLLPCSSLTLTLYRFDVILQSTEWDEGNR
jgi:hypothetical protein